MLCFAVIQFLQMKLDCASAPQVCLYVPVRFSSHFHFRRLSNRKRILFLTKARFVADIGVFLAVVLVVGLFVTCWLHE